MKTSRVPRPQAGFSLVEMLAVIVIIAILMTVLVPRLMNMGTTAKEKITEQFLAQLDAAIAEYEDRFGDFPPSRFDEKWGSAPNTTNVGAEALVLSLWSPEWGGTTLPEERLVNTDADETKRALARFPKSSLFELKDEWGNPIAYFHRRDYGRQDAYVIADPETGEPSDALVVSRTNPTTNGPFNPTRYQLISAGADGEFGTEDDLGNFKAEQQ